MEVVTAAPHGDEKEEVCGHAWLSLIMELAARESPASEGCCRVPSSWVNSALLIVAEIKMDQV